jgi:chromosome segregation ATPase
MKFRLKHLITEAQDKIRSLEGKVDAMSQALDTWTERLDCLQHQEAIAVDSEQKFSLAVRIKEAKAKIAELETTTPSQSSRVACAPEEMKWL